MVSMTTGMMTVLDDRIKTLRPYQIEFLDSIVRYPALVAGIGTGKTMCGIIRGVRLSEIYPRNLGCIVRMDYTDLRDSTMQDFRSYFPQYRINESKKQVELPNGSVIMFRHGSEVDTLKNINLGWFYMEQGEEFPDSTQFEFLCDRLRRQVPYASGWVIANACGHNWVWKNWIKFPPSEDFRVWQATTFDNAENLPEAFIRDQEARKDRAPAHYRRMVLNSHEDDDTGDLLYPYQVLRRSYDLDLALLDDGPSVLYLDVASYGENPDRAVFGLLQRARGGWKQTLLKIYRQKNLMELSGLSMEYLRLFRPSVFVLDSQGNGEGVYWRVSEQMQSGPGKTIIVPYKVVRIKSDSYLYNRDEDYVYLREEMDKGFVDLIPDEDGDEAQEQMDDLTSIRFTHRSTGQRIILDKEWYRKQKIPSPDCAAALMMGFTQTRRFPSFDFNATKHIDGYKEREPSHAQKVGRFRPRERSIA
jgi:hypothetical protein